INGSHSGAATLAAAALGRPRYRRTPTRGKVVIFCPVPVRYRIIPAVIGSKSMNMNWITKTLRVAPVLLLVAGVAHASKYTDTVNLFRNNGESGSFFHKSYGYAVFPTVGEAGFGVGGAYGKGRVYLHGKLVGDTTMSQLSVGFQAG